ncbi:MAG TPA: Hsp33 family molecular chaperone HslO [Acholeplasma sp.]|jgi:molecular chaperone Hsp33|nr:Hsp33 family molecular chaperone HslO [Acholeplasma sp.]
MKDYTLIATAYDKMVRIYVSTSKNLVEEARKIHSTWPTATAALGRFLTVSAMMGLMYKGDERLTLRIDGDGPIKKMLVEANAQGEVRATIDNPYVYLKYNNGKLNVGAAVGNGLLSVTKDLHMKNLFTSSSELQTGEIAEDFTYYFALSEQTPSSVGLGVLVDTDQSVLASGGYILQLMPGCPEKTIETIENIIKDIKPVSTMLNENMTPEDILHLLSNGTEQILDKREIKYYCNSSKEKFRTSLKSLDKETLQEIIDEDGKAEIICNFCNKKYVFDKEELLEILASKEK